MAASERNDENEPPKDLPEGIFSLLDTDLYKLTMQCCVLKYFPDIDVTYNYTNRTPHMTFSRRSVRWLQKQIDTKCPYLTSQHLHYLKTFSLRPNDQVHLTFHSKHGTGADDDVGDIELHTSGLWVETILYEIPLLALISETYFKFCDTEWSYDSQVEEARNKGVELLKAGCIFSEFGSRRRRDYKTQELVLEGLVRAAEDSKSQGWTGKLSGSSNVHFAMRFGLEPVGTVAHEWFMGVAAITGNYEEANETSLAYWVKTFGEGVLGIALTDTFGTQAFLRGFKKPIPPTTTTEEGPVTTLPSVGEATPAKVNQSTTPPVQSSAASGGSVSDTSPRTFAQVFGGVRQDSGDPEDFILMMRQFYDSQGITEKKVVVFSDSLNVELCLKYKSAAEAQGFQPTFGVGTFLTNDFKNLSTGEKSTPLNIVIKISSAAGHPAIKISDNVGKNTGDEAVVEEVKRRLGYSQKDWEGGDESSRWGKTGV